MRASSRTGLLAGMLMGASLSLAQGAQAKCLPATERLLPRPTSALFVAVLITCDSRMDALKAFADVSTKHPDVLASAIVNVEEVDLGKKGVYYRTVVGTPGTKGAVAGTCTMLRAAGYKWCRAMRH